MPRLDISNLTRNRAIYLKLGFVFALAFVTLAFSLEVKSIDYSKNNYSAEVIEDITVITPRTPPERPPLPPPPPELQQLEPDLPEEAPEFIEEHLPLDIPVDPIPNPQVVIVKDLAVTTPPPIPKPKLPKEETIPDIAVDEIMDIAEVMPRFPGCEGQGLSKEALKQCSDKALMSFIYKHVKFPAMAKEVGMEGKVYAEFVIDKNGKPSQFKILRAPGAILGNETIRVLEKMPNWIPGKQRFRPVAVRYRLPVNYQLEK